MKFGRTLRCALMMTLLIGLAVRAVAASLGDTIDITKLDDGLLARAIFEETNRVRIAAKLKPFGAEPKLNAAAETQARLGSIMRPPSHTNPFPLVATPFDRVKHTGLNPEQVAENIASLNPLNVPLNASIYTTSNDPTPRNARTGEPVRLHTYASFARAVVEAWMNSPGHRANIMEPKLHYLGCAAQPSKSLDNVDRIFAVQVFYTPASR